jgi:hypothetical protein
LLAITGCSQVGSPSDYVGSPLVGAGGFIADTHTIKRGPNQPQGDSDNMRRVAGQEMVSDPLLPEPGNIWPGPLAPEKTLGDIEKQTAAEVLKSGEQLDLGNGSATQRSNPAAQKPILVPNGNGTSMLIGPDGSVKTVPTPP